MSFAGSLARSSLLSKGGMFCGLTLALIVTFVTAALVPVALVLAASEDVVDEASLLEASAVPALRAIVDLGTNLGTGGLSITRTRGAGGSAILPVTAGLGAVAALGPVRDDDACVGAAKPDVPGLDLETTRGASGFGAEACATRPEAEAARDAGPLFSSFGGLCTSAARDSVACVAALLGGAAGFEDEAAAARAAVAAVGAVRLDGRSA